MQVFIVVDRERVPLAVMTTDEGGNLTLSSLRIQRPGTYNVGMQLPNGSVRWIQIKVA